MPITASPPKALSTATNTELLFPFDCDCSTFSYSFYDDLLSLGFIVDVYEEVTTSDPEV